MGGVNYKPLPYTTLVTILTFPYSFLVFFYCGAGLVSMATTQELGVGTLEAKLAEKEKYGLH